MAVAHYKVLFELSEETMARYFNTRDQKIISSKSLHLHHITIKITVKRYKPY